MYKCFVSYTKNHKRHWLLWNAETMNSALSRIDLISRDAFISYVRLERLPCKP